MPDRTLTRRWALLIARLFAGPLALVGFFLPWAHGHGPLAAINFTGFTLVGFADRLQLLDLTPAESAALWVVRAGILGVAIAACWQTLLAPAHRWHPAYLISGIYLAVTVVLALGAGLYRSGIVWPPLGLLLWLLGALLFVLAEAAERLLPGPRTHA